MRRLVTLLLLIPIAALAQPCPGDTAKQLPTPPLAAMPNAQVLQAFAENVYGRPMAPPEGIEVIDLHTNRAAMHGLATRTQVALAVRHGGLADTLHVLLYLPNAAKGPAPVVLGLNFYGNSSVSADTGIMLPRGFISYDRGAGLRGGYATDSGRGRQARRWPIEAALRRGYAVATLFCGELYPDYKGPQARALSVLHGAPAADSGAPGAISAWAWGLGRAVDYLRTNPAVDTARIIVLGHSRLGKAALWAGATDTRIKMVISNCSGELGAALSSHLGGERIDYLVRAFPYWFCQRLARYAGTAHPLPIDQHQLLAACAPRPLYLASASQDPWADPAGEYAALRLAAPAWGLAARPALHHCPPLPGVAIRTGPLGYHIRAGRHDITPEDWAHFLDFADGVLRR